MVALLRFGRPVVQLRDRKARLRGVGGQALLLRRQFGDGDVLQRAAAARSATRPRAGSARSSARRARRCGGAKPSKRAGSSRCALASCGVVRAGIDAGRLGLAAGPSSRPRRGPAIRAPAARPARRRRGAGGRRRGQRLGVGVGRQPGQRAVTRSRRCCSSRSPSSANATPSPASSACGRARRRLSSLRLLELGDVRPLRLRAAARIFGRRVGEGLAARGQHVAETRPGCRATRPGSSPRNCRSR